MKLGKIGRNPNSLKALRPMTSERAKELGFGKWMKGKKLPEEVKKKISESNKGGNGTSFKPGVHHSRRTEFKVGQGMGSDNFNWKGGTTSKNIAIRNSREYKLWRKSVFERDGYTCIWCGQVGGRLHADHIKPFSLYPELRLAIDNGRTLCVECHKKTYSYLKGVMKI